MSSKHAYLYYTWLQAVTQSATGNNYFAIKSVKSEISFEINPELNHTSSLMLVALPQMCNEHTFQAAHFAAEERKNFRDFGNLWEPSGLITIDPHQLQVTWNTGNMVLKLQRNPKIKHISEYTI